MAKNRGDNLKGVPALEELAAIADGHQLHAVPYATENSLVLRYVSRVPVFAPNGDIMPQLELLPWMVNLIDYIVDAVEPGAKRSEFAQKHDLGVVSGYFWEEDGDELHSFVALKLGRTLIEADMWLLPSGSSSIPYLSHQRVIIGSPDAHVLYCLRDEDDEQVLCAIAGRLRRTLRHYEDWADLKIADPRCDEIFARFERGEDLTHDDLQCLRDNGFL